MKRNPDLMRSIMLELEKLPYLQNNISALFPDKTLEEYRIIAMHIKLLEDNGYLQLGKCLLGYRYENWYISRITDNGYIFIDCIRSDSIWEKIKPQLEAVGSFALDVIKPIVTAFLMSQKN